MDRPIRKSVSLTPWERLMFRELVDELGLSLDSGGKTSRLRWPLRVRTWLWRSRWAATLLVPLGLVVMMLSVVTVWPLGLVGAGLLGLGLAVGGELVGRGLRRQYLRRSEARVLDEQR